MKNISFFKRGWIVGDFSPSLFKREDIEVGIKFFKEKTFGDGHYHKKSSEYSIIIFGGCEKNGIKYHEGDIIIQNRKERDKIIWDKNTKILVIRDGSSTNDKYV